MLKTNFLIKEQSAMQFEPLNRAIAFLNKDYQKPLRGSEFFIFTLLSSFFMIAFLSFYQPFGFYEYELIQKVKLFSGFGLITAGILIISYLVVEVWGDKNSWKRWEVAVSIVLKILLIGICTGQYAAMLKITAIDINTHAWFTMITAAVAIFPTMGLLIFNLMRQNSQSLGLQQLNDKNDYIIIYAENRKEKCKVNLKNLLYIQSSDNYCEIVMYDQGLKKQLIRNTLKNINQELNSPELVRCHRSYLVNLAKVSSWKGNSLGLKLSLAGNGEQVPVSRTFARSIMGALMK